MTEIMSGGTRRGFVQSAAAAALGMAVAAPYIRTARADDPSIVGLWSPVYNLPCVAIHLHLLPDGKLLMWADDDGVFPPNRLADFSKAYVVAMLETGEPSSTPLYILSLIHI